VEDLGLGADCLLVGTTILLASAAVFTSNCHLFAFLLLAATKKSADPI
jgi:glutamate synthase domain-containing protein 2